MSDPNDDFSPRGTMVLLLIFVVTIILMWGSVYLILLSRGVTI
jgi:hypothetical protein